MCPALSASQEKHPTTYVENFCATWRTFSSRKELQKGASLRGGCISLHSTGFALWQLHLKPVQNPQQLVRTITPFLKAHGRKQ
jgi:hypothetical protein